MGYGEVWWFVSGDQRSPLDSIVQALRDAGLRAGNPATGEPQILENGEQSHWSRDKVRSLWDSGSTVTVQLWLNPETDILVDLIGSRGLLKFDLDGMTTGEARNVVFSILNAALSLTTTVAVFGDRDLPDHGDELMAAVSGYLSVPSPGEMDLIVLPVGGGTYSVSIKPDSWLAGPAATYMPN